MMQLRHLGIALAVAAGTIASADTGVTAASVRRVGGPERASTREHRLERPRGPRRCAPLDASEIFALEDASAALAPELLARARGRVDDPPEPGDFDWETLLFLVVASGLIVAIIVIQP